MQNNKYINYYIRTSVYNSDSCKQVLHYFWQRLSQATVHCIVLALAAVASLLLSLDSAQATDNQCSRIYLQLSTSHPIEVNSLPTLGQAVTQGMLFNENQADIFEIYRKLFFGDAKTDVSGKTLTDVMNILKQHPELQKPHFTEYLINSVEKVYQTPQELDAFVNSQTKSAGQVRSNLFQIVQNQRYWKKLLGYQDPTMPDALVQMRKSLNKDSSEAEKAKYRQAQSEYQQYIGKRFLSYLHRLINKTNLELLADLKNDAIDYDKKAMALFKTLQKLEQWYSKKGRDTQFIRQAMVDLVHTVGFGNQATQALLKSNNGLEKIEGLKKLLDERDAIAMAVGYDGHFQELQQKLNITFPTGYFTTNDPQQMIKNFEAMVLKSRFIKKPTGTLRVRSLTIQESPFRSCLGGSDCSSRTYFDKALDPNFNYFTLTDSNHQSDGHVTVVLGQAKNEITGELENVAFVDKLQNVPNQKILMFLNAVSLSLAESGYKLALPADVGDHNGLSNMDTIRHFVQNEIVSKLTQTRLQFAPLEHQYSFANKHSRAYTQPNVKLYVPFNLEEDTEIVRGAETQAYPAKADLDKKQLIQGFLKLKDSDKPEDLEKYIASVGLADSLEKVRLYTRAEYAKDLHAIAKRENVDFKIRKQAVYNLAFIQKDITVVLEFVNQLDVVHINQILSEIKTYKASNKEMQKFLFVNLNIAVATRFPNIFKVFIKQPDIDLNIRDSFGNTALINAAQEGQTELIKQLLQHSDKVNFEALNFSGVSAFRSAVSSGNTEIVELFLQHLDKFDINCRLGNRTTYFMSAVTNERRETVELFLQHSDKIDLNAKDIEGHTAFMFAVINDRREIVELLLQHSDKIDFNARDIEARTALMYAVSYNKPEIVKLLLQHLDKIDFNAKNIKGLTVLQMLYPIDNGVKSQIAELLRAHGAKE